MGSEKSQALFIFSVMYEFYINITILPDATRS